MSANTLEYILPDLLACCPPTLKSSTNPHYERARTESTAWVHSHNVFDEVRREEFKQAGAELLVSYTWPDADYEQFRTVCDLVNLLFCVDELSDDEDGAGAHEIAGTYLAALAGEPRDKSTISKMTSEFKERFDKRASPGCKQRFYQRNLNYMTAVTREAELREHGEVLGLEEYKHLRRENSAVQVCFGLFEYSLGIELPHEFFEHPAFIRMHWAAVDMVCWSNDVYSYNMEQAKGHTGNNILTVLMTHKGMTLQEAADHVGVVFRSFMDDFFGAKASLPSFGPKHDAGIQGYIKGMENWIVGNLDWSFGTQRYFGPEHKEIKKTRIVRLKPVTTGIF